MGRLNLTCIHESCDGTMPGKLGSVVLVLKVVDVNILIKLLA